MILVQKSLLISKALIGKRRSGTHSLLQAVHVENNPHFKQSNHWKLPPPPARHITHNNRRTLFIARSVYPVWEEDSCIHQKASQIKRALHGRESDL